jgi:hypothetical protein
MFASVALRDLIEGPERPGRYFGTSRLASWAAVGERVMVVAGPEAVRLPNCVVVHEMPDTQALLVGCGAVVFGGQRTLVSRWWDPKPVLAATSLTELRRAVGVLARHVEPSTDDSLGSALAGRVAVDVIDASKRLLGRGTGLTPSGDDVLSGAFAAFLLLGAAIDDPSAERLIASVRPPLLRLSAHDSTTFSGALIGHALTGEVALPVATLLRALAGRGSIQDSLDDLATVGHSSGLALAQGVFVGATSACGGRQ